MFDHELLRVTQKVKTLKITVHDNYDRKFINISIL